MNKVFSRQVDPDEVKEALEDCEVVYTKITADHVDFERIKALLEKSQGEGLTQEECNEFDKMIKNKQN